MKQLLAIATAVLGVFAAAGAAAEDVYKSTMPNGSIVYGESPHPGARRVEKIDARAVATGTIVANDKDRALAEKMSSGASGPSVNVIAPAPHTPPPPLQQGAINPPGVMPKAPY